MEPKKKIGPKKNPKSKKKMDLRKKIGKKNHPQKYNVFYGLN